MTPPQIDLSSDGRRDALQNALLQAHRGARAPLVMGICNVTPDSFSDGGALHDVQAARLSAMDMVQEGAFLIDVGGESTRPGATPVVEEEECRRILPVIEAAARDGIPLSCDTYKSGVARRALAAGAVMINDVGGLHPQSETADIVARAGALISIMHGLGTPTTPEADMSRVLPAFFARAVKHAQACGIQRNRIVIDPGIGFGKTDAQNIACFSIIPQLRRVFDLPVLIGVSRKSLLGRLLDRDVDARLAGSVSAAVMAANLGAAMIRVHDVPPHVDAMKVVQALKT